MTIWRAVRAEAQSLETGTGAGLGWSLYFGLAAVDLGTGHPIATGCLNEYDPQAVQRWSASLVQRHGITLIVTDDLFSYKAAAEKLQLVHQVCQFHLRRWAGKTLKQ